MFILFVKTMNNDKDVINITCKSHTNRSEKDLYRVCPSNLSKIELEDLYFILFQSNINLKKVLNAQQDEIKVLTTKIQRLSAQKPLGNRNKECCAQNMAIINEQKEIIADLKKVNERCTDRIRLLNIKLCSAKQYLRRGPQNNLRCSKCCLASNTSIKNPSMSALFTKRSEANLRTAATSCEYLAKVSIPVKLTQTVSTQTENDLQECDQNKCRTTEAELKQKIANLEQELTKTQDKHVQEINNLETEMNRLRLENNQIKAERTAEQKQIQEIRILAEKLRITEEKCDDLTGQLLIERGKVTELEMMLKAAERSKQVVETLEEQFKNSVFAVSKHTERLLLEGSSNKITSDDSGYMEANKSQEYDRKDRSLDQKILDQILSLKVELDSLKLSLNNDQRDAIKEKTLSYESSPQQNKLNVTAGINATNTNISSIKGITDFNSNLPAVSQERNLITEDISSNINDTTDETIRSTSVNISKIPRLNKNLSTDTKNTKLENNLDDSINSKINYNNSLKTHTREEKVSNNIENIESENEYTDKEKYSPKIKSKIHPINNKDLSQDFNTRKNIDPTDMHTNINKENKKDKMKINENEKTDIILYDDRLETPKVTEFTVNKNENSKADTNINKKDKSRLKKNEELRDKENNKTEVKRRMSYVIETKTNKTKLTKDASEDSIGSKTYSIPNEKPLAASSPYNQGTYNIPTRDTSRNTSPDNTECEISSLTDLPREIDDRSPLDYISPGEERQTTLSESFVTTTDYGSLSEGELPITGRSSYAEVDVSKRMAETMGLDPVDMEGTLRNISEEIRRCKRLLRGKPLPNPTLDSFPFNFTLK